MGKVLSILIPVYNEKATVLELLRRVQAVSLPLEKRLLIVDDGSTDGTRELLRDYKGPGATVIFHERNQGKGKAVRTALEAADGDIVLVQDADLEYDPNDYPALLAPLLDGRADAVYGSRFLGGTHRVLLFWHYFANRVLTLVTDVLYDVNLSDMACCYKAFKTGHLKALPLRTDGFAIDPEITAKICKKGLRLYEVPVSYSGRTYAEGKKIQWTDAFIYLWTLLRYRVSN